MTKKIFLQNAVFEHVKKVVTKSGAPIRFLRKAKSESDNSILIIPGCTYYVTMELCDTMLTIRYKHNPEGWVVVIQREELPEFINPEFDPEYIVDITRLAVKKLEKCERLHKKFAAERKAILSGSL